MNRGGNSVTKSFLKVTVLIHQFKLKVKIIQKKLCWGRTIRPLTILGYCYYLPCSVAADALLVWLQPAVDCIADHSAFLALACSQLPAIQKETNKIKKSTDW